MSFTFVIMRSSVTMAPRSVAIPASSASLDSGLTPTAITTISVGIVSPAISTDSTRSSPFIRSIPFPKRMCNPFVSRYSLMIFPMSGSKFRGKGGGLLFVTHMSRPSSLSAKAISSPIAPPPTTTALSLFRAASRRPSASSGFVTTWTPFPRSSLAPGMGSMMGLLPVEIMRES